MRIEFRSPDGWAKHQSIHGARLKKDEKGAYTCPYDGKTLWMNPGGGLYCNEVHADMDTILFTHKTA